MNLVAGEFHMDALRASNPFTTPPATGALLKPPLVTCTTGDHPHTKIPLVWEAKAGDNVLFHSFDNTDFWTILSLRAPDEKFIHLAHFKWSVSWETKVLSWKGDTITGLLRRCDITQAPVSTKGPPAEPVLAGLKLDGADQLMNEKIEEAIRRIAISKPESAVKENPDWFSNVPPMFYTP
jgi:hypothetical protein